MAVPHGTPAISRGDPTRRLALVEAVRLVRHPAFVLGAIGTALLVRNALVLEPPWAGADYGMVFLGWFPLWLGTLVAAALGAGRGRLLDDADPFPGVPTTATTRISAHLLSLAAPVVLASIAVAGVAAAVARDGGFHHADPPLSDRVAPPLLEWAQVPLLVLLAGAVGIAVAHLRRWRLGTLLAVSLVTFLTSAVHWVFDGTPLRALHPYMVLATEHRLPPGSGAADWVRGDPPLRRPDEYTRYWREVRFDTAAMGWHLVYVGGLAGVAVWLAMRSAGGRPPRWLVLALPVAAVAGLAGVLTAGPS
jgi:hypothetical protein